MGRIDSTASAKGDWNLFLSIKRNDVEYFPGLLFCIKNGSIPLRSFSRKFAQFFPVFFKIKSGKSGQESHWLLARMQKTYPQRKHREDHPALRLEKRVGEGGMLLSPHLSRQTTGGHWEDLCSLPLKERQRLLPQRRSVRIIPKG